MRQSKQEFEGQRLVGMEMVALHLNAKDSSREMPEQLMFAGLTPAVISQGSVRAHRATRLFPKE